MSVARLESRFATAHTLVGFVLLWFLLDRTASLSGSMRGEFGVPIAALVLVAAAAFERGWTDISWRQAWTRLGLGRPDATSLGAALACAGALLLFLPTFGAIAGERITFLPGAPALAVGIFAQGGIAEEIVFRGFLFRRLRAGRSFWSAASLAALPFIAVHLLLFQTLEPAVAAGAIALAVATSFPLALLFERSGGSIWPPAILHATTQGAIKLVDAGDATLSLALGWMLLCAVLPWGLFVLRTRAPSDRADGGLSSASP